MTLPQNLTPTLIAVVALVAIAVGVLFAMRIVRPWAPALAVARGAAQLALISVLLSGVLANPLAVAAVLVVMFVVAVGVSASRIGWSASSLSVMSTSIGAGAVLAIGVVFATGALEATPRYLLALGSIALGNAMSIATLTGRRFRAGLRDHWGEVEGWLALGARPRWATAERAREAVREALLPSLDQTKTTGLVVLPGAFVGALFGGLSPIEAARFQIIVLAAILAAGAVTAALVVTWLGRSAMLPEETGS